MCALLEMLGPTLGRVDWVRIRLLAKVLVDLGALVGFGLTLAPLRAKAVCYCFSSVEFVSVIMGDCCASGCQYAFVPLKKIRSVDLSLSALVQRVRLDMESSGTSDGARPSKILDERGRLVGGLGLFK